MNDLQSAYRFLKISAFHDIPLPPKVTITRKPLKKAWGYWYSPNHIEIDSSIKTGTKLLRVMAHEMCHASLGEHTDSHEHGPAFNALAEIICQRMGWSRRGF